MHGWRDRYGSLPSSYDWSVTHARRRGGDALVRLEHGTWPPASVVTAVFGTWDAAREAAGGGSSRSRSTAAATSLRRAKALEGARRSYLEMPRVDAARPCRYEHRFDAAREGLDGAGRDAGERASDLRAVSEDRAQPSDLS